MRFSEFEEEWEERKFEDICSIKTGNKNTQDKEDDGRYPFYVRSEIIEKINSYSFDGEAILTAGDGVGVGKIFHYINEKVGVHQRVYILSDFQAFGKYVYYYFSSQFYDRVMRMSAKNSVDSVRRDMIAQMPILLPTQEEQHKIATFLTLIDKRIETQRKIIEGYESLIKGLSEKLFSQQIRFKNKNGNKYSDWRIKMLEEIGESFNGLSGKNKDDFGEGKLYIQYKQIFSGSTINVNECGLVNIYNGENQSKVQYGDVFFTVSSETPDEIGMSSVLIDEVDEMYLNSFCFGVRPSSLNLVNPLYMSFLLRASIFRSKVIKLAQGSTRYNLPKVALMKLAIPLPLMEEQKQIAQFLLSIGTKIRVESSILEKYQSQKMYILQNLFI